MSSDSQSMDSTSRWLDGYGVIKHSQETRARIAALADGIAAKQGRGDGVGFYELLEALDRICNAGMWLVVHKTYARNVYLDGRPLGARRLESNL